MLKRRFCTILALILLAGVLSGCSADSLAFLNLAKEIGGVESYSMEGKLDLSVSEKSVEYLLGTQEYGVQKATLSYTGSYSRDKDGIWAEISPVLQLDDKKYDFGTVVVDGDSLYITKQTLIGIVSITGETGIQKRSSRMINEMLEQIGDYDWIEAGKEPGLTEMQTEYTELYDVYMKLITDMFSGFNPSLVKKNGNVYEIKMTAHDAYEFGMSMLKYLLDSEDKVYKAIEDFITSVYKNGLAEQLGIELSLEDTLAAFNESRTDYQSSIQSLIDTLKLVKGYIDEDFKDSALTYSLGKTEKGYIASSSFDLVYNGDKLCSMKEESVTTVLSKSPRKKLERVMKFDEMNAQFEKFYEKYQTPDSIDVMWKSGAQNNGTCSVTMSRYGQEFNTLTMPIYMESGRVYLPAEELDWIFEGVWPVSENNKPKVKVVNGIEMVMVKDMEKSGYAVKYREMGASKIVTISVLKPVVIEGNTVLL